MPHFRFLELPRELRDVVYDLLIFPSKQICSGVDEFDTQATTTEVPLPALLQANKQINSEYTDQLPTSRTLHVAGGHCDYWTGYPDISGALARSITECYVYIHIQCYCQNANGGTRDEWEYLGDNCDGTDFLHNYRPALQEFLSQFPNLRTAHLRLGLWGPPQLPDEDEERRFSSLAAPPALRHLDGFAEALGMLVALPLEVMDLEVVKCVSEEEYDGYRKGEGMGLPIYVTWTREGGWRKGNVLVGDE